MTITREIGGRVMTIELTGDELYRAYEEQQRLFDEADVEAAFDAYEDEELVESYGMTRTEIGEKVSDIACRMRRNIDKYDMTWQYARDEAISEILRATEGEV